MTPDHPKVWVLLGKGAGGNAQMLDLARALGWEFETRQLVHNPLNLLPNVLLGPTLLTLDKKRSDALEPPWPDVIIAASRRSVPVACWIRRQSRGRTKLVHLLHAMAPLNWFDLIITTPQYALPDRINILKLLAPLNRVPDPSIRAAAEHWRPRLAQLPRPWLALLVGGNSSSYVLDADVAAELGRRASREAMESGGSLLVTTSPRTSAAATDALFSVLEGSIFGYQWRPDDKENPYLAFLGLADRFLVTADSASLVVEAALTGKPVQILDWPMRLSRRYSPTALFQNWLDDEARPPGRLRRGLTACRDRLVDLGLLKPPRDFARYHRSLREHGMLSGAKDATGARLGSDDMERAVSAIHRLFDDPATAR